MKKILVTGANGFIGKNLAVKLKELQFELLAYDKSNNIEELRLLIKKCDFVVHLAGSNRPVYQSEYMEVNFGLTEIITGILKEYKLKIPVIFSSSVQADLENPYGVSKKKAEELLRDFSRSNGNNVYILRLSNVFGKWCRPENNSVTATFCYNIANNKDIKISDPERILKLVYIDDVISHIINLIDNEPGGGLNLSDIHPVYEIKLVKLAELIYSFKESRLNFVLPDISDDFTRKLYSTYLSYLDKNDFKYALKTSSDKRGNLTELLKSHRSGQIFMSSTKPGETRGNHYHHTKTEKFIVIKGKAIINFRNINDDEIISYEVCGDRIEVVDIPPGYTHSITNAGEEELITLFWANEIFNDEKPDTNSLAVCSESKRINK